LLRNLLHPTSAPILHGEDAPAILAQRDLSKGFADMMVKMSEINK
jgi:hypothetical protein